MEYRTKALIIKVRPDDIVEIIPDKNWVEPDTLEIAKENVAAIRKAVDGKPRGLLSENPNTYLSREVMNYYNEAYVGEVATAMLSTSFGSKIVGNLFLKLTGKSRGDAPVRIFAMSDRKAAIEFLLDEIAKAKKRK
ncbi:MULTISPECIES: hypothetical protein [unclassified Aureispira]|uniref:hypothetical protein n=1 Tax=unclassified Aureispira TaxID=2649989 RepID=UPI00069601E8|nr:MULTISPECIES: hypothetical protein [unclassified Aureispira]WMX12892.1 hypothetical protein QP953_18815 [Aureispira sp. CCB-E]